MGQKLVSPHAELALPLAEVGIVGNSVRHRIQDELEAPLWEAGDGCGPVLSYMSLNLPHSQPLHE